MKLHFTNDQIKAAIERDEDLDCEVGSVEGLAAFMGASVKEEQIKRMVSRFLSWKLPEDFGPDGGIKFDPAYRSPHGPSGTNLFNAVQAEAMVRHLLAE